MITANVYDHPTVSWDKAKTAWDQIQRKEGELLTHWVELGQQLNMLRKSNLADKDFGAACEEHGIDMSRQHRKAAMWWAGLSQDQRETLSAYHPAALHPATLENRCREQFPEWLTSTRAAVHSVDTYTEVPPESPITAETATETSETSMATEEKSDANDQVHPASAQQTDISDRIKWVRLVGSDTAKKICACWSSDLTRQAFNVIVREPGGKAIIKRIAELTDICDAPIAVSANGYAAGIKSFSHRLFVPQLPKDWGRYYGTTWNNLKAIKVILDQVPDAIRMHQELGDLATLKECRHWWLNRDKPRPATTTADPVFLNGPNLEAFSVPQSSERMDKPAIGAEHEPIRVHTVDIWPNPHAKYDFEQAWAAFHFWQDIGRHMASLKDEGSEVRGRFLMELKRWLEYASDGFANAFHKIAAAEHQHPDKGFDTTCPPKQFRTK